MRKVFVAVALLGVSGGLACGDTWWRAYEADGVYPEGDEWTRFIMGGGAQRSFADGALVLDGLADPGIVDAYYQYMPSLPDPGQELFIAQWRLRVAEDNGGDAGVLISFGSPGDVFLKYEMNRIYSMNEFQYVATFEPGVFHEYALTTDDLATYALYIDGAVSYVGELSAPGFFACLEWGITSSSSTSATEWQWVRYGVVPEPSTGLLLGTAVVAGAFGTAVRRRTLR